MSIRSVYVPWPEPWVRIGRDISAAVLRRKSIQVLLSGRNGAEYVLEALIRQLS